MNKVLIRKMIDMLSVEALRDIVYNMLLDETKEVDTGENVSKAFSYPDGTIIWYLNGELHREDGPAVVYENGTKHWYLNGELHREDGPAIEYFDGDKYWYLNGKSHRTDGPAIERVDGTKYWYLNGKEFTEKEFNKLKK